MYITKILLSNFKLELPKCLNEGHAFNITNGTTQLGKINVGINYENYY